jgi:prepilin signal peptidase PulO-like enzyme (type II secretory pathway)
MILPDKITYPLITFTIISFLLQLVLGRPTTDIPGVVLSVVISSGLFWLFYLVSKGKWIGGGDIKLGFLLGMLVARPELAILLLFLSSVLGMIWVAPLLFTKKLSTTSKLPYGPFLITASIIVVLYGPHIINWYKSLFLIS